MPIQQRRPAETVDIGGDPRVGGRHGAAVGQSANLHRQVGGSRVITVPKHAAQNLAERLDVFVVEQWGVQNHRMYPTGMPHAQSGCQIAAIGRAVDDRSMHIGIVKYCRDVVDDLFNGQRRRR